MLHSTPEPRRFPPIVGYPGRADFEGGALSSDFGALLLRGIDRQIGLTQRLAAAVQDKRHPSLSTIASVPSLPSVSTKLPLGMRTAMMPIVCGTPPWSSLLSSGHPWSQSRTWRVAPPSRVWNTA
jgi:Transposase DDE domain group 1